MESVKNIQRHIIYGFIIVMIINIINISNYFIENSNFPSVSTLLEYLGWSIYFTTGLYVVNAFIVGKIQRSFPRFDVKSIIKKFVLGTVSSAIISMITGAVLYILFLIINGNSPEESLNWLFSSRSEQGIQFIVFFSIAIVLIFQTLSLVEYYQSGQLREQKQKVSKISAEHESLKSQISSHFLFNSLNVLSGLIDENTEKAQDFIGELSSVYRYVLEEKDREVVPLEKELEFARNYMNLIQMRYEEGLQFALPKDFSGEVLIVPLSLQTLLENCVKHNQITSENPLRIKMNIEDDRLIISNNLQPKKLFRKSTQKGLTTIKERYFNLTERGVEIFQNEKEFRVSLPLLTQNEIKMNSYHNYTKEQLNAAKKRVEEIQGFYWNLGFFVIINSLLTFLDIYPDGRYDWAMWPLIGSGIGVFFHGMGVFGVFNNSEWKNKMIQKELEKSKNEFKDFKSKLK